MGDFVKPEPIRLSLSGDTYIDIKKRLNHGETEEMYARWAPFVTAGEKVQLNRREVRTAKVLMYLIGWSLTDDGAPVPMSPTLPEEQRLSTLNNLDPDRFDEIHKAIEAHEDAQAKVRADLKKTNGGLPDAKPISTLPSASAGGLSGSVN